MAEKPEIRAVLAGILGYVPTVSEMRAALARTDENGEEALPESTYYDYRKKGYDVSPNSLYRVARYYDISYSDLLHIFGWLNYFDKKEN